MSERVSPNDAPVRAWLTWLAIGWLLLFGFLFFRLDLPNTNPPVNRTDIWRELPHILYDCVVRNPASDATVLSWRYISQRVPVIATGMLIMMGAYGLGHLLLRILRLQLDQWSLERNVLAAGLGLSGVSLLTLSCGLLARTFPGVMSRELLGGLLIPFVAIGVFLLVREGWTVNGGKPTGGRGGMRTSWHEVLLRGQIPFPVIARVGLGIIIGLFVTAMALGSMLPSVDFDVKEYHLQGPKEWYQAGAITLLSHNVYTSFPFLTEMFPLLGMVLTDDWQRGALVGKFVLMLFGPLTALGVFALARRWFDSRVAWAAALIHISTPWTYRISVIAYAEGGLTFYLLASLLAVLLVAETSDPRERLKRTFICGLLAGSAMACKYPGILSVVMPVGATLLWMTARAAGRSVENNLPARRVREGEAPAEPVRQEPYPPNNIPSAAGPDDGSLRRALASTSLLYILGCAITIGPWLAKNLYETGNPVYPLLNSVFHGSDWTPTLEANWKRGHGPPHHDPADLAIKLFDVTIKSDWLSPLLFSMAPLTLLVRCQQRLIRGLWLYVGFLFLSWWVLTHRIDRFWVPLIPLVSLLAGIGIWWTTHRLWRFAASAAVGLCVLFNLAFIATPYCGLNAWLADYDELWDTAQLTSGTIRSVNAMNLPPGSKVLCVGEAQVFDARFPLVYNTVFDISIFEQWCSANEPGIAPADQPLKPAGQIRQKLIDEGVTLILVNWAEILRYRMTYGYADFVAPRRFAELLQQGIVTPGPPLSHPRKLSSFRPHEQAEIRRWGPELILQAGDETVVLTSQLFFVTSALPHINGSAIQGTLIDADHR